MEFIFIGRDVALTDLGINQQIANRVRRLRAERGLSLDALAAKCGVSRSMISLIERGEASATAVVLEKIAVALNITLAALFNPHEGSAQPVARFADQSLWRDPASGYVRRNVSPTGHQSPIQIVEVVFPVGGHVTYETSVRQPLTHQQIWVLDGAIEVTVGETLHELQTGDCLTMVLDGPIAYRNRGSSPARYAVILVAGPNIIGNAYDKR